MNTKGEMMVKKAEFNIEILKEALVTLKESWATYNSDIDDAMRKMIADSCVKRFEYTEETSWKLMKKYLKLEYGREDKELTINNVFRLMEGYGFIESWENWRKYLDARNDTSHEYNIEKARNLISLIPDLIIDTEFLIERLEKTIEEL